MSERKFEFEIGLSRVEEIRKWFRDNHGVAKWKSVDLSAPRPDLMSPLVPSAILDGTETKWTVAQVLETPELAKPHWAYVFDKRLTEADICVGVTAPIMWPRSLFKLCEKCQGTCRRDLAELAAVRSEPLEQLKAKINPAGHTCPPYQVCNECIKLPDYREWDETFQCTYCNGTGRMDHGNIYARMRHKWFGPECMAKQKVQKLQQQVGWLYGEDAARGCVWMDYEMVDSDRAILRPSWYWTLPLSDLDKPETLDRVRDRLQQLQAIAGCEPVVVTPAMRKRRLAERADNKPPQPPAWPREAAERIALEAFLVKQEGK